MNDKVLLIEISDYIVFDKIHSLSVEYAIPVDVLVNIAVKRLFDYIEYFRGLRNGVTPFTRCPDELT